MSNIEIHEFSTMPELATAGWDPNACDASDYGTARAAALYDALGVSPRDEEYALARHADGRLALIGLTVEGHKWASEKAAPTHRIVLVSNHVPVECAAVRNAGHEQSSDLDLARTVLGADLVRRVLVTDPQAWAVVVPVEKASEADLDADPAVIAYADAP